ncbi:MAG: hypothetical protein KGJ80_11665 [Chloroflexota bacterium]|nr:hypothetical protein [Chloroflexota bacterium]
MAMMVRKQVYLKKRQATLLKLQARQRSISEAELIREAIERQIEQTAAHPSLPNSDAWERAHALMLALRAEGPLLNRPRRWTREELYEERMNRYAHRSH